MALISFSAPSKGLNQHLQLKHAAFYKTSKDLILSLEKKPSRSIAQKQSFYAENAEFSYHQWCRHSVPSFCLNVV